MEDFKHVIFLANTNDLSEYDYISIIRALEMMEKDYLILPFDYFDELSILQDDEFGRLIRALGDYARYGKTIELEGNERFFSKMCMMREDAYKVKFDENIQQKRRAGLASAEARRQKKNVVIAQPVESAEANNQEKSEPPQIAENIPPLILNTGEEYRVLLEDYKAWVELYPAVDIDAELRKMAGWCMSNPQKRKTPRGIRRFINTWLAKVQDTGKTYKPPNNQEYNNFDNNFSIPNPLDC